MCVWGGSWKVGKGACGHREGQFLTGVDLSFPKTQRLTPTHT